MKPLLAQFQIFPEQASAMAAKVDGLFIFLTAITGTVALGICVLIVAFAVKYRRQQVDRPTPRITGSIRLELTWSIIPMLIFCGMFAWGANLFLAQAQPPAEALNIYVVGKQWMWKVQHPEGQREINHLHVPLGRAVKLILTSEDVIHDWFVPNFRTRVDVLPGRYVYTWFEATRPGEFPLYCSQYCGTNHGGMTGYVTVTSPAEYQSWLDSHAEGSLALEGRKLFLKLQCINCHTGNARGRAPILENLYGQSVPLRNGQTVVADESYLRESIVNPEAKVVTGFEPIMPTYKSQVDEEDLIKLIAFIRSLGPGETPVRTEDSPPPALNPSATQPAADSAKGGRP